MKLRMLVPLVTWLLLVGLLTASHSSSSVPLLLADSTSQEDKVLILSEWFQQSLFADSPLTLTKMREVFFPSSKYRYWHVDNIEIIDIKVCINFQAVPAEFHSEERETLPESGGTQCLVFRWTNSYFVNLVDIRQMTYFEFVTTGVLFSAIAYGRSGRIINMNFNLSNENVNSIEDTVIKQALIQFLSWSKLYARSQATPDRWEGTLQGYVTRKYDYTAVDLFLFDEQNKKTFIVTLTCFILCNTMTMYLLLKWAPLIYTKFRKAVDQKGYRASVAKGALVLAAVLVLTYLIAVLSVYAREPALKLTAQCEEQVTERDACIPKDEFPTIHRTQVLSLTSSFTSLLTAMVLYSIGSIHTVKTSTVSVFNSRYKYCEAFLLWSALTGIHIAVGLASIPLFIFTVLTPMFMIFCLSSIAIILAVLLIPTAAVFHLTQQIKEQTQSTAHTVLQIMNFIFVYLVGTGIITTLVFLYYLFLTGGASMSGVKGALYSLLPPLMISAVVFTLKRKTTKRSDTLDSIEEKRPLLFDSITEHL